MNVVDLINDERIPWVIIKEISDYNRRSIHGFWEHDIVVFDTLNTIKRCFSVKFYGGIETLFILSRLRKNFILLKQYHPDWKYQSMEWEEITTKMLRTYVKMARKLVNSTPQSGLEDPAFITVWAYVSDIFDIILEGSQRYSTAVARFHPVNT